MIELIMAGIVFVSVQDKSIKEENSIELNCGSPDLWYSYHYRGRSVSSCSELIRLKSLEIEGGDPNL